MRNQFKVSHPIISSALASDYNGIRTENNETKVEKANQDAEELAGNRPEETISANTELKTILRRRHELILKSLREAWESSQYGDTADENRRLETNFIARTYHHYQKLWNIKFAIDHIRIFTKPKWEKMYEEES